MTLKVTHFMIIMLVGLLKLTQFLLGSACHVVGSLALTTAGYLLPLEQRV